MEVLVTRDQGTGRLYQTCLQIAGKKQEVAENFTVEILMSMTEKVHNQTLFANYRPEEGMF